VGRQLSPPHPAQERSVVLVYVGTFVQYNADTDQVVTNARFRFIHAPLSDLYVVFTERRDMAGNAVLERFITVKFTRLFGF
jgi:hypothetical protein